MDIETESAATPGTGPDRCDPHRRPRTVRWTLGIATLASAATLAAACSAGPGGYGSTAPPPATAAAAGSSQAAAAQQGTVVPVQMTEFHLQLPATSFTPGTYTFTATNAGSIVHALNLDGPGVSDRRTPGVVQPGGTAALTVTLQPGTYTMYCPVDDHRGMGMVTMFTVGTGPAGSPAPAAPAAPSSSGGSGGY